MKSVVQHMGDDIPRLRLGVDIDDRLGDLTDFVLANFTSEELNVFDDIFDEGLDEILNV